jgi:WD40 repeat protein
MNTDKYLELNDVIDQLSKNTIESLSFSEIRTLNADPAVLKELSLENTPLSMALLPIPKRAPTRASSFLQTDKVVVGFDDNTIGILSLDSKSKGQAISVALKGHTNWPRSVSAFSSKKIISGSGDNTIKLWDLDNKKPCLKTLQGEGNQGHTDTIRSVIFLSGHEVLSGSKDKSLKVWNLTKIDDECVKTLKGHSDSVLCTAKLSKLSRGGYAVVSGSADNTIKVWETNKREGEECINTLEGHSKAVNCLIVISEKQIVSGSDDGTIRVWDLSRQKGQECVRIFKPGSGAVECLAFWSDFCLASSFRNGKVKIWNFNKADNEAYVLTLNKHRTCLNGLAFTLTGEMITASEDNTIKLIEPPYRKLTVTEQATLLSQASKNHSLKKLDLSQVKITGIPSGLAHLHAILKRPTLNTLNLNETSLTDKDFKALLPIIEGNDTLIVSVQDRSISRNNLAVLEKIQQPRKFRVAAAKDEVKDVIALLLEGAVPDYTVYESASEEVKFLFDYRPGRKNLSIYNFARKNGNISPDDTKKYEAYIEKMKMLVADYEDTTNETSSDSDSEKEVTIYKPFFATNKQLKLRSESIEQYNKVLQRNPKNNDYSKFQNLKCVVYRGLHYDPTYFGSKAKRHAHSELPSSKQPAVSYATLQKSGIKTLAINEKDTALQEAHKSILHYFEALKESPDKKERGGYASASRNGKSFDSLYFRFIQTYVESYATLFNHTQMVEHYGFETNDNPALSTSILVEKAGCYAGGIRMNGGHALDPHYRRFTLKPKHPCVGVLYAYVIDLDYFFTNACFILDHKFNERIGIDQRKQFEYEVMFESMIPGKYQICKKQFVFPSYAEFPKESEFEKKFEYSQAEFNNDRKKLTELPAGDVQKRREWLKDINKRLVSKQNGRILQSLVERKLASKDTWIAYPFKDKQLTGAPVLASDTGRWKENMDIEEGNIEQITKGVQKMNLRHPSQSDSSPVEETDSSSSEDRAPLVKRANRK